MDLRSGSSSAQERVIGLWRRPGAATSMDAKPSGDEIPRANSVGIPAFTSLSSACYWSRRGAALREWNSNNSVFSTKEIDDAYHHQYYACCCACARLRFHGISRELYRAPRARLCNGNTVAELGRGTPGRSPAMELRVHDRSRSKPV